VEELETYEVKIACKRQEHDVGYAEVERLGEVRQTGVVFACLLPEVFGQRLYEHQKMTGHLPHKQPKTMQRVATLAKRQSA
jgi:hypothetical protein